MSVLSDYNFSIIGNICIVKLLLTLILFSFIGGRRGGGISGKSCLRFGTISVKESLSFMKFLGHFKDS